MTRKFALCEPNSAIKKFFFRCSSLDFQMDEEESNILATGHKRNISVSEKVAAKVSDVKINLTSINRKGNLLADKAVYQAVNPSLINSRKAEVCYHTYPLSSKLDQFSSSG